MNLHNFFLMMGLVVASCHGRSLEPTTPSLCWPRMEALLTHLEELESGPPVPSLFPQWLLMEDNRTELLCQLESVHNLHDLAALFGADEDMLKVGYGKVQLLGYFLGGPSGISVKFDTAGRVIQWMMDHDFPTAPLGGIHWQELRESLLLLRREMYIVPALIQPRNMSQFWTKPIDELVINMLDAQTLEQMAEAMDVTPGFLRTVEQDKHLFGTIREALQVQSEIIQELADAGWMHLDSAVELP